MAARSQIIDEQVNPLTDYPKLMINREQDIIVLFYSPVWGTVVHDNEGTSLGMPSDAWDMANLEEFHGTIQITM